VTRPLLPRAGVLVLVLVALPSAFIVVPAPADAQVAADDGGRRPGLGGRYTRRSMTVARNALYAIAGPWAPMLLGQRRYGYGYDGGLQLVQSDPDAIAGLAAANAAPDDLLVDLNLGVGFGLFDHFEAGAMFLSFRFSPDFDYGGFPVFLTYWWELGPVDVGARVVWFTFYDDAVDPDDRQTTLNPSVPVVVHLGTSRIDTGIFVPIGFRRLPFDFRWADDDRLDVAPGLSIPLRYSYNPIPELVLGAETGFYCLVGGGAQRSFCRVAFRKVL